MDHGYDWKGPHEAVLEVEEAGSNLLVLPIRWIKSTKKPPGSAIKYSDRCKLLIMGLRVAMAKASAIPNIDLSQVKTKDLNKAFKRLQNRMGC